MKTIYLPAGTEYVQFDELAHKIAIALHPSVDSATDGESFAYFGARDGLEAQLLQAANSGALPVKDPLTFGPHSFPFGRALKKSLVSVSDLRVFLAGRPIAIESEQAQVGIPSPAPVMAVGASDGDDESWKSKARIRAYEIIKRDGTKDLYPSQLNIADEIAREFRRNGLMGADGKPIAGSYIKRHALAGISSARGKRLSTSIRQGK